MDINLIRGSQTASEKANINIIIDVIRAFTVSHLAFYQGARKIYLVKEVEEAFELKRKNPDFLLLGEVKGLPIAGFDGDNSPVNLQKMDLQDKVLVQRTTNGVKCVLNNLSARYVLVTGYTCAINTVEFVKNLARHQGVNSINIIASNPKGDEDFACAEYIRDLIIGDKMLDIEDVKARIINSYAAEKFFEKNNPDFIEDDIHICVKQIETSFVMRVDKTSAVPAILTIPLSDYKIDKNF